MYAPSVYYSSAEGRGDGNDGEIFCPRRRGTRRWTWRDGDRTPGVSGKTGTRLFKYKIIRVLLYNITRTYTTYYYYDIIVLLKYVYTTTDCRLSVGNMGKSKWPRRLVKYSSDSIQILITCIRIIFQY